MSTLKKLNIGCGRRNIPGWVNLDCTLLDGVDIVCDLNTDKIPLEDNTVSDIYGNHVLEHISNPLFMMQELHRIAIPDGKLVFNLPHGGHDDAWVDPTHVREYFEGSFWYFSQLAYFNADYGYRGDWRTNMIILTVPAKPYGDMDVGDLQREIKLKRNIVSEMRVEMTAVKPVRVPDPSAYSYNLQFNFI